MPLAAVITPATLPCSANGTARQAPAVKPGRVKPKPSEASREAEHQPVEVVGDAWSPTMPTRGDQRAPQDQRARVEAERAGSGPIARRGRRRRRPSCTIAIGCFGARRRDASRSMTKKPMQVSSRRLGMAGDDAGDDPAADARVAPVQPLRAARRGRGDDAGAGRPARRSTDSSSPRRVRRGGRGLVSSGSQSAIAARTSSADQREGEQRAGQAERREHEQRRDRRADDGAEAEARRPAPTGR